MPSLSPRRPTAPAEVPKARSPRRPATPFLGLIDAVIVEGPADFAFDGAILREHAEAAWTWVLRDLAPDLIAADASPDDPAVVAALESLIPELLNRAREKLKPENGDVSHRMKILLGSDEAWDKLPTVLNALRCRALLEKAQGFGRAANNVADDASLAMALQSLPLQDQAIASLLLQALVAQVANPARLVQCAIRLSGGATEQVLQRAGFGPMIEAMLAHAQNQLPAFTQAGTFADVDLICRSIDRFHRLVRAVNGFVELSRTGRWSMIIASLTKTISDRLDPRLRDVPPDVNRALRKRDGTDRLDADQVLVALNGLFLVATVRDCRDSLAVNALFDQVWAQIGQSLEIHLERNLEMLRNNPFDAIAAGRLDAGIKMAELRFNAEYADVLRRAKDAAIRRTPPAAG